MYTMYTYMNIVDISDKCVEWFRTYLKRSQSVRIGNNISPAHDICSEIAQGTVLSPLIFINYINVL